MYCFNLVTHEELTSSELDSICNIKGIFGSYTMEQQIEWIECNIEPLDKHLLMYLGNKLVGYLNLINIELTIDSLPVKGVGIGNVCVSEQGKGFGAELMNYLTRLLTKENWIGMLFCNKATVKFYNKYGWDLLDKSFCDKETMVLMNGIPFKEFSFSGRQF